MNIVKISWVDICFFSGVEKDYNIEYDERPFFTSIGVDLGKKEMFGKEFERICYNFIESQADNYSIVYIPAGNVLSKETIGDIKEI